MKLTTLLTATAVTGQLLGSGLYAPYGLRAPVGRAPMAANVGRAPVRAPLNPYASLAAAPVQVQRAPVMQAAPMRAPVMQAPRMVAPAPVYYAPAAPAPQGPPQYVIDDNLDNIVGLELQTLGEGINALNWVKNPFPGLDWGDMYTVGNSLVMMGRYQEARALDNMVANHLANTPPADVNQGMVAGLGHVSNMFDNMATSVLFDLRDGTTPVQKGTTSSKFWLMGRNDALKAAQGAYDYAESQFYDYKIDEPELDIAYQNMMEAQMLVASQVAYLAGPGGYGTSANQPVGDLMLVQSADFGLMSAEDKYWVAEDAYYANPTELNMLNLDIAEADLQRAEAEKMARIMDFNMQHQLWEVFWTQAMDYRTEVEELKLEKMQYFPGN